MWSALSKPGADSNCILLLKKSKGNPHVLFIVVFKFPFNPFPVRDGLLPSFHYFWRGLLTVKSPEKTGMPSAFIVGISEVFVMEKRS